MACGGYANRIVRVGDLCDYMGLDTSNQENGTYQFYQHPEDNNNTSDTYMEDYWFNQRVADLEFDNYKTRKKKKMTPEQIADIGVSGKGYWLFVRNDKTIIQNEGILMRKSGNIVPMKFKKSLTIFSVQGPFAIYKWVPYHRS